LSQINKKTGQFSVKIPKSFAERAGLSEKTIAHIQFRPNKNSFEEAVKSDLIIYFDEETTDEKIKRKKNTQ